MTKVNQNMVEFSGSLTMFCLLGKQLLLLLRFYRKKFFVLGKHDNFEQTNMKMLTEKCANFVRKEKAFH